MLGVLSQSEWLSFAITFALGLATGAFAQWFRGWIIEAPFRETLRKRRAKDVREWAVRGRIDSFRHVDLRKADLIGVDLGPGEGKDQGADLSHANLRKAYLAGARLPNTTLEHADLVRADLGQAILSKADLWHADLRGANLSYAVLDGAVMQYADLRGVDLTGASLRDANLINTNVRGAILSYADLTGTRITEEQLSQARDVTGIDRSDLTTHEEVLRKPAHGDSKSSISLARHEDDCGEICRSDVQSAPDTQSFEWLPDLVGTYGIAGTMHEIREGVSYSVPRTVPIPYEGTLTISRHGAQYRLEWVLRTEDTESTYRGLGIPLREGGLAASFKITSQHVDELPGIIRYSWSSSDTLHGIWVGIGGGLHGSESCTRFSNPACG